MHWDASENALTFRDDTKLKIGTGNDLSIYHDGTDSYLYNTTGDIVIQNHAIGEDIIFKNYNNTEVLRLKSALVKFSKKITDSSDVPIIARNIIHFRLEGDLYDQSTDGYQIVRDNSGTELKATITSTTANCKFLVSSTVCAGMHSNDHNRFSSAIYARAGTSGTWVEMISDYSPTGQSGASDTSIYSSVIPNALIDVGSTFPAGTLWQFAIFVRTSTNGTYSVNGTESGSPGDDMYNSFITVEEIPVANG